MTFSHSAFIIVLTLLNIAGALWLLWWTRRSHGEASVTTETTGHVWDGDLREHPPQQMLLLKAKTFITHLVIDIPTTERFALLYPLVISREMTRRWISLVPS